MQTTYYGATILLSSVPDETRLAEIAARVAEEYLPEIESCDFRLSDTIPESVPALEASHLLTMRNELPGSTFLLVYPAKPERPITYGKIPS